MLARLNDDLGDAYFAGLVERFAQESVSLGPGLLRLQIVRPVEKHRVDFLQRHKFHDLDGLGSLYIRPTKVFLFEHDKLPFLIFIAFDDILPRNLLSVGFGDTLILNWA